MEDQIQQTLMAKQQKLIGELVARNMVLESCVEVLKSQLAAIADRDLDAQNKQSNTGVDSAS